MRYTFALALFIAVAPAQTKAPLTPKDYGQFETLVSRGLDNGLSPDGKWLVFGINRPSGENELRITNIADGTTKVIAFGERAAFSSDSQWAAYSIGYSEKQEDKLKKDKKPVQKKLGLMNLTTRDLTVIDNVEAFAFSPNGAYLAFRHSAPEKAEKKEKSDTNPEDEPTAGATLIVRQLATGRDTTFGNVAEFAWQDLPKQGRLLAFTISAEDKTGNGVQLFDPQTGSLRVLDSGQAVYSDLAWRKKSSDLAALKSASDDAHEEPAQIALAWTRLTESDEAAHIYEPAKDSKFPGGMRVVAYRKPSWEENGGTVFLGLAQWHTKPESAKKDKDKDKDSKKDADKDEEEKPAVDVWHWRDVEVLAKQKLSAKQERQQNMLASWDVASGHFVRLGVSLTETVHPLKHQHAAYVADWTKYAMERSIGRPAADLYLVDEATGERTRIQQNILDDYHLEASPAGKYLIFYQADHYWTVDVATHGVVNITKNVKTSFANVESDAATRQKPPFGVAGWTKDDAAVILYDKYDLWQIAPDGSKATRLTDGAANEVRHRYVELDPDEEAIDTSKPAYVSLFGIWSKQSGYARITWDPSGTAKEEHLLLEDKRVHALGKAKDADVFSYAVETFEEPPVLFAGSSDLHSAKEVAKTNPFQSKYAWGHTQLIEYTNSNGVRLQGTLYYPPGYEVGKKYPMIVYMYEKLSDGVHNFTVPSERSYYNSTVLISHGYFLLQPDIVFRRREPGLSVEDCVGAAVNKVIAMGVVDPKRIGIIGHSWGGFDTAFLSTHSHLFAAGVAGAPITDLVSNYGNHHWSSGIAETDHIETGQQRMEVPLYDDLDAYIRNSAVFHVKDMTTALMIEVGDSDGTVFYHQGVELYNIARRAGKNVVLLIYGGEDHGLHKKPDQVDYQHRILAWFGHFLKDEPAPVWITQGESYLDQQRDLKEAKAGS